MHHKMFKNILFSASNLLKPTRKYSSFVCNPSTPFVPCTFATVLGNGVRVGTEESCSPLACISLFIEAGPRFETAHTNGVTHFIEHMAFKGFNTLNRTCLEECLNLMGAKMTVHTSREIQVFSATCPTDYAANIVDIYSKILSELLLSECEIESEKHNICLELIDTDNDPKQVLFDYLHQTAFQGTPLAQPVIGPTKNIRRFDRNFVAKYMCEHYQPYRLVLATSGNVYHHEMVCHAQDAFGNIIIDPCGEGEYGPCRFTGSQITYRDDSMPFAHVAIAFEAPGYSSGEYLTLLTASNLIGSWDKSQDGGEKNALPLARAASAGHLCESFESFYIAYRDIGLWGIYFVADRMALEDMLYNIQNAWMHLCTTTQAADVQRAVNKTKLLLAKAAQGSIHSSYDIGKQLMYLCSRRSVLDQYAILADVKAHNIKKVADKYLYDRCPAVAAVGPTDNLPEYTRIRAGQYWLRL